MLRKSLIILFINLLLAKNGYCQSDLDSLGNIWIITVDKSGSMLWNSQHQYTLGNRFSIAASITRRITNSLVFDEINYAKDRFIFFNSGILHGTDLAQLKLQSRFDTSFIHHTDESLHTFKEQGDLVSFIQRQLELSDYTYSYSFVSQIRLFSIVKGLDFIKDKGLTDNFNHLLLITITDDADQNDQWMNDYKTVKKYAPKKLMEVNELTTKYLFNPFNTKSDISKSGAFSDKFIDESEIPHINFYEYKTTQSLTGVADSSNSLLAIQSVKDHAVNLGITKYHFKNDSILFFYIDSIVTSDSTYVVNQYIIDTLSVSAKLKNWFNYNTILVTGYFQVLYTDNILGKHYKKYQFKQSARFPSAYLVNFQRRSKVVIGVLLLLIIVYIIIISPRKKLFTVYDNQGRKYTARKGAKFYGPYHYWKKGENSILNYTLTKGNKLNTISKKQKNLIIGNHTVITEEIAILIASNSALAIENQNLIPIKPFTTKNDIEEHHEAKKYNPTLESIYQTSVQFRLFRFAKRIKAKNSKFFLLALKVVNTFWKRHYYLVAPTENDFKNTSISFSGKTFRNKTFTIELSSIIKHKKNTEENTSKNIACLNDFFSNEQEFADGIIAIHHLEDQISWNVLKLDYQNSLRKVYHLFHFIQKCENTGSSLIEKEVIKNVSILNKLSRNAFPGNTNFKYYLTSDKEEPAQLQGGNSIKLLANNAMLEEKESSFIFIESVYPAFIYLVEAKDIKNRITKQIYSPFKNGLQNEIITQTPSVGEYHIYSCFAPALAEKGFIPEYCDKITDNIFSFATIRDLQLTIDSKNKQLHYANHTINLNNL